MNLTRFLPQVLGLVVGTIAFSALAGEDSGVTVHEWGTFTSVQGGDGALRSWKPLETASLPDFVYNSLHPGLNRQLMSFGKGRVFALQRLETPVVYFYSEREQTMDLAVKFPSGRITEWYPQADQVGPSYVLSLDPERPIASSNSESMIGWNGLHLQPARSSTMHLLPAIKSGVHYGAARETDSDFVIAGKEMEKFLFYRGVGDFSTPLQVTMTSDSAVTLSNRGPEALSSLFVFEADDIGGNFVSLDHLRPGKSLTVSTPLVQGIHLRGEQLTSSVGKAMASALVRAGLYPKEAKAMVNTWKDSWFTEKGLRVFYLLPRPWTDRTLAMTIQPAPDQLVRVMVGRAEILTPALENNLSTAMNGAKKGDAAASARASHILKDLGRFAWPAYLHAFSSVKPTAPEAESLWHLLSLSASGSSVE